MDARALDDLGQEHLAGAEEVADDAHAVHQRSFDDVDRACRASGGPPRCPRSMKSTMPWTSAWESRSLDRGLSPGEVDLALLAAALHVLGELDHALRRVVAAVEDDVLDVLEEILRDVLVESRAGRVDDAHVHAGLSAW